MGGDAIAKITDKTEAKGGRKGRNRGGVGGARDGRADTGAARNGGRGYRGGTDKDGGKRGGRGAVGAKEEKVGEGWRGRTGAGKSSGRIDRAGER